MEKPVQIFMPVAGGFLRDIPRTNMDKRDVALVSKHIMAALHYLHRKRYVHGDIKPENILYENRGTGFHFLLADLAFQRELIPRQVVLELKSILRPRFGLELRETTGLTLGH